MSLELIADYNCHVGEGPLWHADKKQLFWLDIPQGRMFRYDPSMKSHEMIYEDRPIGGYTIQADGNLLCFRDKGNVVLMDSNGQVLNTVIEEIPELVGTRFNDVLTAPDGSVFAGTISTDALAGRLYHVKIDGSYSVVLEGQGTPNGMGFSLDEKSMYYQDSRKQKLFRFDYDVATGELSNQTLLRTASESGDRGRGDGMTVDANGDIWSARWDGGCVIHCDPDGVPKAHYDVPAKCVSCITFAGDDFGDLYITTAGGEDKAANGEGAGGLFKLDTGVRGKAEYRARF